MSKKTHQKNLERKRAKRAAQQRVQRRQRSRLLGVVGIAVLLVVVIGVALATRDGGQGEDTAVGESDAVARESDASGLGEGTADGAEGDPGDDASVAGQDEPAPQEVVTGTSAEPCEEVSGGAPEPDTAMQFDAPPEPTLTGTVTATVETACGTFVMELDADAAPQAVASFAFLAEQDYFAGVPFHRVKDDFVIQGGDPTGTGTGGPGYAFADELALAEQIVEEEGVYPRGTVAMANSGPDTNGSQFFVVQPEEGFAFPPQYTVFGRVVDGMDVVDRIAQGPVTGPRLDLAVDPVQMIDVTIG